MDFRSDNTAGAAPQILAALAAAGTGARSSYGEDEQTRRVQARLQQLFETDLTAGFVATGTAANALGLALLSPPWGVIYCHEDAHVAADECAAPEFYTGGAKLWPLAGAHGKLSASQLAALLPGGRGVVHQAQPAAVSLSQATEAGTAYRPAEIAAIAEVAHRHGLRVHMDGARFANALAFLGTSAAGTSAAGISAADLSWRAGVDVLSFGASKNGALAAEAVIVFDRTLAQTLGLRRKRGGHLLSKMRFMSAQLDAYLAGDLWLRLARHANGMAARLAAGLAAVPGIRLCHPVEANEVFVDMPEPVIRALLAEGFQFYRWPTEQDTRLRLVSAFDTRAEHVDALIAAAARAASPL
ncbi:MAG TPA: beta-eliminating lyase-related protein [Steroidobacteraceae bacterium]|jgi:threonine aldolase|nr:beta-eliminating lyase-related protein [Steroidobacteraceae bacterium]